MKKFLHNVAARFKSMREGRTETQYEVVWNENNINVKWLTLENETGSLSFLWESVISVDTCQRSFKSEPFSVVKIEPLLFIPSIKVMKGGWAW